MIRDSNLQAELDFDVRGIRSNVIPDTVESLFECAEPVFDEDIKKGSGKWVGEGPIKVFVEDDDEPQENGYVWC